MTLATLTEEQTRTLPIVPLLAAAGAKLVSLAELSEQGPVADGEPTVQAFEARDGRCWIHIADTVDADRRDNLLRGVLGAMVSIRQEHPWPTSSAEAA